MYNLIFIDSLSLSAAVMFVNVMTINNIISLSPRSTVKVSLAPSYQCVRVCVYT